jgi:hypothetical protein
MEADGIQIPPPQPEVKRVPRMPPEPLEFMRKMRVRLSLD